MPSALRPATPADVPFILALIRELAEYEREPNAVVATEALLHRHLFGEGVEVAGRRTPINECLLAELDGVPQGFAFFFMNFSTWTGRPGVYLEDLFVRPAARGKGLGLALMKRLARIALDRGCSRLQWSVLDWNEPAINFYKRLGAEPVNEWTVWRLTGEALERLARE
jgi:GNAT superfamily N-acetyltransferase